MAEVTEATIRVNGAYVPLADSSLLALLADRGIPLDRRGIAIAVNGAVVPRSVWHTTLLCAGDDVEIVIARQGG